MTPLPPLAPNPPVMDFLLTRRSRPAKTLTGPGPDRAALVPILTAAARVPDHGKLEPFRFVVLHAAAMRRLSALVDTRGQALGIDPDKLAKAVTTWANAPLAVIVVASPKPSDKVPRHEQELTAGAVCLGLLNAALASGWGANWLTGWMVEDREFVETGLGLSDHEFVAGIMHIGRETTPPPDRPRPDLDAITRWMDT